MAKLTYGASTPHGSLILKLEEPTLFHRTPRYGIYSLARGTWAKRPFTADRLKAHAVLRGMRVKLSRERGLADRVRNLEGLAFVLFGLAFWWFVLGGHV